MPNRIIREAILSSEKMALLGWPEEVFYRRLMSIVDDYGRHEANPQLLRARCYPLQTDNVRTADITRWMAACQKAGLILGYEVADKRYLEVINFGQQQRSASKCPPPPACASKCAQAQADAHVVVSEVVSEVVVEKERRAARTSPPECPDDVSTQVWADWLALRKAKRAPVSATVLDSARSESVKAGMTFEAFLTVWCRRGSQGLEAAWLKPDEKPINGPPSETAWQRSQRELVEKATGGMVSRKPSNHLETANHVAPLALG